MGPWLPRQKGDLFDVILDGIPLPLPPCLFSMNRELTGTSFSLKAHLGKVRVEGNLGSPMTVG